MTVNAGVFCFNNAHFSCHLPSMINPIKTRIPAKENKLRDVASEKHINTTDHLAMAPAKSL